MAEQAAVPTATPETLPETRPERAKPEHDARSKPKRQPPYAVILHNDPINGFDYVVGVLQKVFGYSRGKAFWLTLKAHTAGRSLVWSGHKEVAELKADQLRSCGADPRMTAKGARPLKVSIEEMP